MVARVPAHDTRERRVSGRFSVSVEALTRALDDLGAHYVRNLRDDYATLPVQGAELRFLLAIYESGPLTGTRMAQVMGVSRAAVSILGKRLLEKNFVDTRPSGRDRRTRYWGLTADGQSLLKAYEQRRAARFRAAWKGMSAEERRIFLRLVRRWSRAVDLMPEPHGLS